MPIDCTSCFFLDRRHIIYLPTSRRNPGNLPHFSVMPFGPAAASSCYTFALPEFMQHSVIFAFLATCPLETNPSPDGDFYSDPADRLISIEISNTNHGRQSRFIIDVPACTFTRYIAAHPVSPGNPTGTITVPWDAWGTHGARVTVLSQLMMMGTISGSRRATWYRRPASDDPGVLTVLDYSPRRVARALAHGSTSVLHGAEVDAEYTGSDFGPLRTTLPCIASETPLPDSMAGIVAAWICENGVLFTQCHPLSGEIVNARAYTI
ncbi:hypothetical protein BV25DRAFT_1735992 [Artomyces pyxidatus]|uniref:Uncharacterized protein n=1 Tax=Artomyces pyxidatus TaxID=48021 RepID=A0ACB8SGS1_9AGAM|nr:hypothetical protein BV25DRAFT_1735992 [Artomyces pyxidatus]